MNNPFHLFAILFIYAVIVQSEDLHENTNMQTPAKEIIGQQPVKTEQSMTKEKTETKMPNKQTSNADKSNKAQRTKKKKQGMFDDEMILSGGFDYRLLIHGHHQLAD
ncbi:unnamed protein product [Schistosoma turkestanicum]|nr:unnamed protein product [Schistosoma turkestanicum]